MDFDRFLKEVSPPLDIEWRKYRRRSARHRVESRMRALGIPDFPGYLELVRSEPAEAAALPDLMRVTVSRFFRERGCWDFLSERVLPGLLESSGEKRLRAWSAGCCGGEEPYTLAIIGLERFGGRPGFPFEVLATDIDGPSLGRAKEGIYAEGSMKEMPREAADRWFVRERGIFRIRDEVKRLVRFEERNLMTDPAPEGMDLILCRYLAFTYYKGGRLEAAAAKLRDALRPGGVLMVGLKEAGAMPDEVFGMKREGWCFYLK